MKDPDLLVSGFGIGVAEGMMPMKKIFLDDGNQAVMACSNCFKTSTVNGSDYEAVEGIIKIKLACECGTSDSVILERRKSFRKEIDLPGVFIPDQNKWGTSMTIRNLSVSGMGIWLSENNGVRIGDKITVEFQAGSGANNLVRKDAVVRHMEGDTIGIEFRGNLKFPDLQTIRSLIFT